jgi:arsenite methyltransferase
LLDLDGFDWLPRHGIAVAAVDDQLSSDAIWSDLPLTAWRMAEIGVRGAPSFGPREGLGCGMAIPERVLVNLSRQLGRPAGPVGRVIGRLLNRGNRSAILAAVHAAEASNGDTAAEIGFGGGAGLALLLNRVGPSGVVHGVEISQTMLAQARRRFKKQLEEKSLRLHEATMQLLPLEDTSVDSVVSTNTIYFVGDLNASMSELARVLRPGGRLALGVGDPAAMAKVPFTKHGFILRPIGEVVDSLRLAGFAAIEDRRVGDGPDAFHVLACERPSA